MEFDLVRAELVERAAVRLVRRGVGDRELVGDGLQRGVVGRRAERVELQVVPLPPPVPDRAPAPVDAVLGDHRELRLAAIPAARTGVRVDAARARAVNDAEDETTLARAAAAVAPARAAHIDAVDNRQQLERGDGEIERPVRPAARRHPRVDHERLNLLPLRDRPAVNRLVVHPLVQPVAHERRGVDARHGLVRHLRHQIAERPTPHRRARARARVERAIPILDHFQVRDHQRLFGDHATPRADAAQRHDLTRLHVAKINQRDGLVAEQIARLVEVGHDDRRVGGEVRVGALFLRHHRRLLIGRGGSARLRRARAARRRHGFIGGLLWVGRRFGQRVDGLNLVLILSQLLEVEEDQGGISAVAGSLVALRSVVSEQHVAVVNDGLHLIAEFLIRRELNEQYRVAAVGGGFLQRRRRHGFDARRIVGGQFGFLRRGARRR